MTIKPGRRPSAPAIRRSSGWVHAVQAGVLALALAGYVALVGVLPWLDARRKEVPDTAQAARPRQLSGTTAALVISEGEGGSSSAVPTLPPLAVTPIPLPTVALPNAARPGNTGPLAGGAAGIPRVFVPGTQAVPTLTPRDLPPLPTVAPMPQLPQLPRVLVPPPMARSRGS